MKRIFKNLRDYLGLRAFLKDPWKFVWSRKDPMSPGDFEIVFKDGLSVRCNSPSVDRQVLNGIFGRDEYRLNGYAAGSWDTVIDIGAHIGLFTIRVAPLAKRVLSFEPMPASFKYLKANVGVDRFRHVQPIPKAVSGKGGPLELFVSTNTGMHSVVAESAPGGTRVQVDSVTLAEIFKEHAIERCDLLKLDCEGAEYDILGAVPADLWPRIRRIHMEFHPGPPGWDGEKLAATLEKQGYACERIPRKRHPEIGHLFAARR